MNDVVATVLDRLPAGHSAALRWLAAHEGEVGSKPWPKYMAGQADAPEVKLTAQRGIHVPSGWRHALSVTLSTKSKYQDGDIERQDDGTWVLLLRAHEGKDGIGLSSRWNRGLFNCWRDRTPVAIFRQVGSTARYEWLGLAFVDDYDGRTRTFLLHGPVHSGLSAATWGTLEPLDAMASTPDWFIAEDEPVWRDARVRATGQRVIRPRQGKFKELLMDAYRGKCAVTGYDAHDALDAAHILPYLGTPSDTAGNGLLLRADVHRLFDRYLLTVDSSTMRLVVGDLLAGTRYEDLHDVELKLPDRDALAPNPRNLELHRQRFVQAV